MYNNQCLQNDNDFISTRNIPGKEILAGTNEFVRSIVFRTYSNHLLLYHKCRKQDGVYIYFFFPRFRRSSLVAFKEMKRSTICPDKGTGLHSTQSKKIEENKIATTNSLFCFSNKGLVNAFAESTFFNFKLISKCFL